jgi:hypothetical protein
VVRHEVIGGEDSKYFREAAVGSRRGEAVRRRVEPIDACASRFPSLGRAAVDGSLPLRGGPQKGSREQPVGSTHAAPRPSNA